MMKKVFFLFLTACFFLCGCVKNDQSVEIISFATWGSASEMAILKPIISDFEKQNTGIKINLMHIPQNYFQKIHLLFASNLAPDVIFINNLNLPVYANHLMPLSLNKNVYYKQVADALSYNGKSYAIPRDVSNLVVYYNKDMFDSFKVAYPDKTWSLDTLLSKAQMLTSVTTFGIGYEEDMFYVMPYILAFNESIYPAENVKNLAGMKFYKNLVRKYHVAPSKADVGSKTLGQLFLEGKIAMHLSGRWLVPKYSESAKFNWDVINFPGAVPCDASGWAISKDSKHKESALKFVEFLSSKENITKMVASGLIVPARKDVLLEDKVFTDVIKTSQTVTITPSYNKMIDKLNDTIFLNNL